MHSASSTSSPRAPHPTPSRHAIAMRSTGHRERDQAARPPDTPPSPHPLFWRACLLQAIGYNWGAFPYYRGQPHHSPDDNAMRDIAGVMSRFAGGLGAQLPPPTPLPCREHARTARCCALHCSGWLSRADTGRGGHASSKEGGVRLQFIRSDPTMPRP